MSRKLILSFLLLSLLFGGCSSDTQEQSTELKSETIKAVAPISEYHFTTLNKTKYIVKKESDGFSVADAEGKVIIFNIFATWCPPCQAEATHLTSLQERYKDELLILAISVEESIPDTKLQSFRSEFNAQYPIINSAENRSFIDAIASKLNIGKNVGIPLIVLYKDGKFLNFYQGATEEEFIESDIKRALGK